MKDVRLCLIGTGRAGMIHAKNFRGSIDMARVIAVCDPNIDSAKNAAAELGVDKVYRDYKKVMEDGDVDAVIIATPTKFHREIAVAAANAKKHILCEKPMAMTVDECDEMIEAAELNNVKLQIGFMRRFDESFVEAKKIIESGEIGEVVMIKSHTRGPSKPQEWMYDIKKSNGPLAEVCSHDIDTIRWFAESEVKSLYAIGGNYRNKEIAERYPDFYDNVIMNLEFKNGIQASIEGAQFVKYGYDARVEVLGTEGLICLGDLHAMNSWTKLFKNAYYDEDKNFIDSILYNSELICTGEDGKRAVEIVKAGNDSIVNKEIIYL